MDAGTDALELLKGSVYHLKLGYFGVKCRSQLQIDNKISIKQAIKNEAEFFNTHPSYATNSAKMGIPFLTRSLNKILVVHIQRCIPDLARNISATIQQKDRELLQYNSQYQFIDSRTVGPMILSLISKFVD